jgi:hypothetical protein
MPIKCQQARAARCCGCASVGRCAGARCVVGMRLLHDQDRARARHGFEFAGPIGRFYVRAHGSGAIKGTRIA